MEQYRTEEEQVEALKRWWDENGRSTIAAVIIALSAGFAWQTWKGYDRTQKENASDAYQSLVRVMAAAEGSAEQREEAVAIAEALKQDHAGSSYAQFAALHLARLAVESGDLAEAEAQLRWVLGKADKGSDIEWVAQLRLARVLASNGDAGQALNILEQAGDGPYRASYAMARGDILLQQGRADEAREAYGNARAYAAAGQGQVNLPTLDQKLQSLSPVPPRELAQAQASENTAAGQRSGEETADATVDAAVGEPAAETEGQ